MSGTWDEAYALANSATAKLTTAQKIGIIAGKGQFGGRCVGETYEVTDNAQISIPPLCYQDGPAGLRYVLSLASKTWNGTLGTNMMVGLDLSRVLPDSLLVSILRAPSVED